MPKLTEPIQYENEYTDPVVLVVDTWETWLDTGEDLPECPEGRYLISPAYWADRYEYEPGISDPGYWTNRHHDRDRREFAEMGEEDPDFASLEKAEAAATKIRTAVRVRWAQE
tara:strand:+ start:392 stop:730 length:339 start_codon:yes stop_codon:yes gene_type:complete